MTTLPQIRGLLLEEAILYLLRSSCYRTIELRHVPHDPTLQVKPRSKTDIEVIGRGSPHQIDAIADYMIAQPFSSPQRLLVEAKCYREKIEIDIVRNAVGVLKDVSEYYGTSQEKVVPVRHRYHYQYALFSASDFTVRSQQYAYAHDIHLFPLAHSAYMQPILATINKLTYQDFGASSEQKIPVRPGELRAAIRAQVRNSTANDLAALLNDMRPALNIMLRFSELCKQLGSGLLMMIDRQFPVLLLPSPENNLFSVAESHMPVRVKRTEGQWFLESTHNPRYRLSFDLPRALFLLYAKNGQLSKEASLDLKGDRLGVMQAFYTHRDGAEDELTSVQMITFELDQNWLNDMRKNLSGRQKTQ